MEIPINSIQLAQGVAIGALCMGSTYLLLSVGWGYLEPAIHAWCDHRFGEGDA